MRQNGRICLIKLSAPHRGHCFCRQWRLLPQLALLFELCFVGKWCINVDPLQFHENLIFQNAFVLCDTITLYHLFTQSLSAYPIQIARPNWKLPPRYLSEKATNKRKQPDNILHSTLIGTALLPQELFIMFSKSKYIRQFLPKKSYLTTITNT
jgi:hypothetical protein